MRFYSGWSIVLLIFRGWTTNGKWNCVYDSSCINFPSIFVGIPSMADDITGSVDPAVVTARSNVQLSCTFSHDIYVFLHWVHPNPVVSVINVTTERFKLHIFDNKVVLTMCAVRESDGGEYMCVFSNALGSYAQIVQIHYLHPVSFLSLAGQTFSFFVDTSAQIECLAEHHQTIQWELANGAVIIGSDRVHSDQLPNGTSLTFENVLLSDTGTYYCIAKNNLTSKRIAYYLQVYGEFNQLRKNKNNYYLVFNNNYYCMDNWYTRRSTDCSIILAGVLTVASVLVVWTPKVPPGPPLVDYHNQRFCPP